MNNYVDFYSRYHHKPVTAANPFPSGNSFLYSAYAAKVGLPLDHSKLEQCFALTTIKHKNRYELIRNPGMTTSPFSRDEVLGATALGLLKPKHLNGWNFSPFELPSFNLFQFTKQLVQLYKHREDRNYFWRNGLGQIYRFSFSVPLSDRYFLLKNWGTFQFYNPAHLFYRAFAFVDSKLGQDSGIRFLKYGKSKEAMVKEFPEDHPLVKAAQK